MFLQNLIFWRSGSSCTCGGSRRSCIISGGDSDSGTIGWSGGGGDSGNRGCGF